MLNVFRKSGMGRPCIVPLRRPRRSRLLLSWQGSTCHKQTPSGCSRLPRSPSLPPGSQTRPGYMRRFPQGPSCCSSCTHWPKPSRSGCRSHKPTYCRWPNWILNCPAAFIVGVIVRGRRRGLVVGIEASVGKVALSVIRVFRRAGIGQLSFAIVVVILGCRALVARGRRLLGHFAGGVVGIAESLDQGRGAHCRRSIMYATVATCPVGV